MVCDHLIRDIPSVPITGLTTDDWTMDGDNREVMRTDGAFILGNDGFGEFCCDRDVIAVYALVDGRHCHIHGTTRLVPAIARIGCSLILGVSEIDQAQLWSTDCWKLLRLRFRRGAENEIAAWRHLHAETSISNHPMTAIMPTVRSAVAPSIKPVKRSGRPCNMWALGLRLVACHALILKWGSKP
jgi:hypothetical protein